MQSACLKAARAPPDENTAESGVYAL